MNRNIYFLFALLLLLPSLQLKSQDYFWVAFTDKNNSALSLAAPSDFLSERAIQRREKQNIAIDSLDLPVNSNYISEVLELGVGFVHASKWLNGITVKAEKDSFATKALQLPFVKEIQRTKTTLATKSAFNKFNEPSGDDIFIDASVYGSSVFQTATLNGQFLHNQGFKGEGVHIAILDAGFLNADTYPAFDSLWANGQILGTFDFVNPNDDFFNTHYHGMSVLSCIGGNVPGSLIGTATEASFWLLRSEEDVSEFIIEEDNWVAAAEFADSVGCDIINSSLGYYHFDDPGTNHTYKDMNGKTTRVTRGANIAASRGMLVFSSAGNEGNKPWKYIIAPADGDEVIGVGAVGKDSVPAYFTSYGPASDYDIKPNVSAVGFNTFLQLSNGTLGFANGTSFSSPVMAGMAASLWQSHPNATAFEIKMALENSAHLFENPTALSGYGIPDIKRAWTLLMNLNASRNEAANQWLVYPNPFSGYLVLQKNNSPLQHEVEIDIYSIDGRLLRKWQKPDAPKIELQNISSLPNGILLMKISSANHTEIIKLSKTR